MRLQEGEGGMPDRIVLTVILIALLCFLLIGAGQWLMQMWYYDEEMCAPARVAILMIQKVLVTRERLGDRLVWCPNFGYMYWQNV